MSELHAIVWDSQDVRYESMISKMIQPSSVFEISAITNSDQVDVRRFDRSSTPLSISWEWQKYN